MMQYDGDLGVPEKFLVSPPAIDRTMSEYLSNAGIRQFVVSETQNMDMSPISLMVITLLSLAETWMKFRPRMPSFEDKPRMQAVRLR